MDEFLSSPSLCVETIWEAERKRFVEEDKGLDSKAKLLVTLGNLALLCEGPDEAIDHQSSQTRMPPAPHA